MSEERQMEAEELSGTNIPGRESRNAPSERFQSESTDQTLPA